MATKFINLNNLATFLAKLRTLFVAKELKTGSTDTYKVLSDNNLTDELVTKIQNAGDSTFSGAYADLTGKPSIGGKEIASGDQTAASLGFATPADVTTAANQARTGAVDDVKKLGYQTAANVETSISAKGYQNAAQVNTIVTGKGYQTAANVDAKVNAAKTELQNALGSAFRAKGSVAYASLPAPHPPPRATCGTSPTSSPPTAGSSTAQARPCPPAPTSSPWPSPPATPPS